MILTAAKAELMNPSGNTGPGIPDGSIKLFMQGETAEFGAQEQNRRVTLFLPSATRPSKKPPEKPPSRTDPPEKCKPFDSIEIGRAVWNRLSIRREHGRRILVAPAYRSQDGFEIRGRQFAAKLLQRGVHLFAEDIMVGKQVTAEFLAQQGSGLNQARIPLPASRVQ